MVLLPKVVMGFQVIFQSHLIVLYACFAPIFGFSSLASFLSTYLGWKNSAIKIRTEKTKTCKRESSKLEQKIDI